MVEERVPKATTDTLRDRGHIVEVGPELVLRDASPRLENWPPEARCCPIRAVCKATPPGR